MIWQHIYMIAVALTVLNAHLPVRPLFARNHVFGAEIIALSWLASWAAREWQGDWSPIAANAAIDLVCVSLFTWIAVRKQAIWAATCSLLHIAMLFLHFALGATGEVNELLYIWFLNSLFAASLIVINTAIFASKHEWGARLDAYCMDRLRGWSWSGVRASVFSGLKKPVA